MGRAGFKGFKVIYVMGDDLYRRCRWTEAVVIARGALAEGIKAELEEKSTAHESFSWGIAEKDAVDLSSTGLRAALKSNTWKGPKGGIKFVPPKVWDFLRARTEVAIKRAR